MVRLLTGFAFMMLRIIINLPGKLSKSIIHFLRGILRYLVADEEMKKYYQNLNLIQLLLGATSLGGYCLNRKSAWFPGHTRIASLARRFSVEAFAPSRACTDMPCVTKA